MAGTVSYTRDMIQFDGKKVSEVITFSWTGTAGGAADGATTLPVIGRLGRVVTNPTDGPTDNYDVTLTDADGMDVMGGALANRDTANTEQAWPSDGTNSHAYVHVNSVLTLNVAASGISKSGTVTLHVELL